MGQQAGQLLIEVETSQKKSDKRCLPTISQRTTSLTQQETVRNKFEITLATNTMTGKDVIR